MTQGQVTKHKKVQIQSVNGGPVYNARVSYKGDKFFEVEFLDRGELCHVGFDFNSQYSLAGTFVIVGE
jgi:hypothetical protein